MAHPNVAGCPTHARETGRFYRLALGLLLATAVADAQTTYFVRPAGGTATQCTGTTNADYPGSGTGQACAFSHPFIALPPGGTPVLAGGDTLIVAAGSYMMGYGAPGAGACEAGGSWGCTMPPLPSGPDAAHPTRLLGAGWDSGCTNRPELWGTERADLLVNLTDTSNAEVACFEITDHSSCVEFHSGSLPCQRETSPYGPWASVGLVAEDSSSVRLADLDIHGLSNGGVHAGRLTNWTVERVRIAGNGMVGWDGDIMGDDSNSGTMTFRHLTIEWNGCGETYPGGQPTGCWAQSAGGYGDGLGTGATVGNWVFEDSSFLHNTSDGLDLLYARSGSSITIRRVHSEGNAGDQIKTNGPVSIENTIAVSNCGNFEGQPFTHQVDPCRAGAAAMFLVLREGAHATVWNSTIAGEGDGLVTGECDREASSCNGQERIVLRNNVFIGTTDFLQPDDLPSLIYQETFPQGDALFDVDYSVIRHVKDAACPGTHHTCGEAAVGLVNEGIDSFDAHLLAMSPARDAGTAAGAPADDFDGMARDGQPDIGAYEYRSGSPCTVTCSATVSATATAGVAASFTGSASAANCSGQLAYDWDFGDGSAHAATASSSHAFAAAGSYAWRFQASADGQSCSRTGSITVAEQIQYAYSYLVPSVAHAPGVPPTTWRTDVAVVNYSGTTTGLVPSFVNLATGAVATLPARTLPAGATEEWKDVLAGLFAFPASTSVKGALRIDATAPLAISSRTYNQETATRTYGQYYPALEAADGVATGQRGVLPQLKKSSAFRTNIGFGNAGTAACSVRYHLVGASGGQLGSPRTVSVPARAWVQDDDAFTKTGAGGQAIAYAVVEVQTASCRVWAYASVVDQATGDPTTIPVLLEK